MGTCATYVFKTLHVDKHLSYLNDKYFVVSTNKAAKISFLRVTNIT
jgi:hypothetical protein